MRRRFGSSQTHFVDMIPSITRIALECIGNIDALYHDVEHTMLVTQAMTFAAALHLPHAGPRGWQ